MARSRPGLTLNRPAAQDRAGRPPLVKLLQQSANIAAEIFRMAGLGDQAFNLGNRRLSKLRQSVDCCCETIDRGLQFRELAVVKAVPGRSFVGAHLHHGR